MGRASKTAKVTPVYVPYATFNTALNSLRADGIPGTGTIDKTLWDSQSGAIQGQLILAFKFLGLIDENRKVQPGLPELVEASDETRKPLLKKLIEDKYKNIIALDLSTISEGQLSDAFRGYDISGSTLVRAVRFFVKACQEVGIPISSRIAEKKRASSSTPRRRRGTNGGRRNDGSSEGASGSTPSGKNWEEQLLAKFPEFDPTWPEELKSKWFEGFDRLLKAKS